MSLLHKNAVLKEYRRQHREEEQKTTVVDDGADDAGAGAADAFPRLDVFQEVGAPPASAATSVGRARPQRASDSIATVSNADARFSARSASGMLGSAPLNGGHTAAAPRATGNDDDDDEFPDLDRVMMSAAPPLSRPSVGATGLMPLPPAPAGKQGTVGPGVSSEQRNCSDLLGEDNFGAGAAPSHLQPTDSPISLTTVTIGVEAAANPTDGSEIVQGQLPHRQPAAVPTMAPVTRARHPIAGAADVDSSALVPSNAQFHADSEHPSEAEVSASSSASSSPASPPLGPNGGSDPSRLCEAAVRRLSMEQGHVADTESPDHDRPGGSAMSGAKQTNMSDTLLQPPTSIVSEPSIATLRLREKPLLSFSGSGGQVLLGASHEDRPMGHAALDDEGSEENVFSPITVTDDHPNNNCNSAVAHRNGSLADSRLAMNAQQLTSLSATARTLPRIWDDEDVDVDPTATMTDTAGRTSVAAPSIAFYEAFLDLTQDLRCAGTDITATATMASRQSAACQAQVPLSGSTAAAAAAPAPVPVRGGVFASVFSCCGGQAAAATAAKQSKPSTDAPVGSRREHMVSVTAATTVVAPDDPETDLHMVRVLKSQPLSLQLATHRRMLLTVFNTLTGKTPWPNASPLPPASPTSSPSPPSTATAVRWESIGFQGTNPATDVRATGVLGVLQLLYLIDYYPAFAQRLWRLCRDPGGEVPSPAMSQSRRGAPAVAGMRGGISNELPFVLVCFNFTAVVLDAAGQHVLDAEVEKAAKAMRAAPRLPPLPRSCTSPAHPESHLFSYPGMLVCCECYVGALVMFVEAWHTRPRAAGANHDATGTAADHSPQRPSIADFGAVKSRLRDQLVKRGAAKSMREAARSLV